MFLWRTDENYPSIITNSHLICSVGGDVVEVLCILWMRCGCVVDAMWMYSEYYLRAKKCNFSLFDSLLKGVGPMFQNK